MRNVGISAVLLVTAPLSPRAMLPSFPMCIDLFPDLKVLDLHEERLYLPLSGCVYCTQNYSRLTVGT